LIQLFFLAAEANSVETINLLIENNAVIDCIDLHNLTPLNLGILKKWLNHS
jgi:hypothetical protein